MKAEETQQRSLLELSELDAELARMAHRVGHLPEQQERERIQAQHTAAADRLAALELALEDGRSSRSFRVGDRRGAPT